MGWNNSAVFTQSVDRRCITLFASICPSSDGVHRAPAVGLEFGHSLAVSGCGLLLQGHVRTHWQQLTYSSSLDRRVRRLWCRRDRLRGTCFAETSRHKTGTLLCATRANLFSAATESPRLARGSPNNDSTPCVQDNAAVQVLDAGIIIVITCRQTSRASAIVSFLPHRSPGVNAEGITD